MTRRADLDDAAIAPHVCSPCHTLPRRRTCVSPRHPRRCADIALCATIAATQRHAGHLSLSFLFSYISLRRRCATHSNAGKTLGPPRPDGHDDDCRWHANTACIRQNTQRRRLLTIVHPRHFLSPMHFVARGTCLSLHVKPGGPSNVSLNFANKMTRPSFDLQTSLSTYHARRISCHLFLHRFVQFLCSDSVHVARRRRLYDDLSHSPPPHTTLRTFVFVSSLYFVNVTTAPGLQTLRQRDRTRQRDDARAEGDPPAISPSPFHTMGITQIRIAAA